MHLGRLRLAWQHAGTFSQSREFEPHPGPMLNEAETLAKLVKRLKEEINVRTEADRVRQAFAAELLALVPDELR